MEEPHLVESERNDQQRPSRGAVDKRDEWDQPDEVLRREETGEGEEPRHRRGEGDGKPPAVVTPAPVEPGHGHHRHELQRRAHRAEDTRQRATEVVAHGAPRVVGDADRVAPGLGMARLNRDRRPDPGRS